MKQIEELLALALMTEVGFDTANEYENKLNEMFEKDYENDDLLELEYMSGDILKSCEYLKETASLDKNRLGQALAKWLKKYYSKLNIYEFARKAYRLWNVLPADMQHEKPFFALSYGDEPLCWGDEKQAGKIYEEVFSYYE